MGEKLHPELEQLRAVFQQSFIQVEFFETTEELKGHFTFALLFSYRYTAWWKTANYKQTTI